MPTYPFLNRFSLRRLCLTLSLMLLSQLVLHAQLPTYSYGNTVRALTSPYAILCSSVTEDLVYDAAGNVYTIGDFYGSVDANPGSGTTTLSAASSGIHTYAAKYDASGALVWAKCLQGTGTAEPRSIAIDASGNVFLTGTFSSTVDFDPGSGTSNLTAVSNFDMFMMKLDANGGFLWAKKWNATSFVSPNRLDVDANGNVVCVGYFSGTCDFNPNTGTTSLTGASNSFVLKMDGSGNLVYVKQFTATSANSILDFQILPSGDMLLCGFYTSTTDFDPDAGVTNLTVMSFSQDMFVCKLTGAGALLWARGMGGANSDEVRALDIDAQGNIIIAGTFRNSVDFDPGPGSFVRTTSASTMDDIFVAKYTSNFDFIWARQIGSPDNNYTDEQVNGMAVDPSGNIVLAGFYYDEVDFDPNPNLSFPLYTGLWRNTFVMSLTSIGAFNYAFDFGMPDISGSETYTLDIDDAGNLYIGGYTDGQCDVNPATATNYITSDTDQAMLIKYGPPSSTASFNLNSFNACTGVPIELVSTNSALQTSWQWLSTSGTIANANAANTTITFNQTGEYPIQLTTTSALGTTVTNVTVLVGVAPSLSLDASSNVVCGGNSVSITANYASGNLVWSTGSTSWQIFVSPTTTTTYTATLTASNGCTTSLSETVTALSSVNPVITVSDNAICNGESVTLTASGAADYYWDNGMSGASITVNPTSTTTYSLNAYAGLCSGQASQTVTVSSAPNLSISGGNSAVCGGASVTLTATGASSYLWSTGQTTASITVSPSSTTTYTVTGTNAAGCSNTATRTVTVGTAPTVNVVASNNTPCAGTSIVVTAVGASTYVWGSGQTTNAITVSPTQNTTYTVTGTNAQGCQGTGSLTINVDPLPVMNISSAQNAICAGASVSLLASGADSYSWNSGQNTAQITVSPTSTTTYTVTGTNSFGCTASANKTITVNALPNVNIQSAGTAVCSGSTITLTGTGASTYVWSTGETANSINVSPTVATTYTVTGTSAAGCVNQSSRTITVQNPPAVSIAEIPGVFCVSSGTYALDALPAGGTFSGSGVSGNGFNPNIAGVGMHEVVYVYSDGVCSASDTVSIEVDACVGVSKTNVKEAWTVFPNPARTALNIQCTMSEMHLEVLDMQGRRMAYMDLGEGTSTVDASQWAAGVYVVRVEYDGMIQTQKIVIQP